ncbi:DUF6950 family protein [Vibrio mediterranei]
MMIEQLNTFLTHYQDTPFKTGVNDCALFAAHWIKLRTGEDLAARFQGRYLDDEGSHKLITEFGFKDLEDMVIKECDRLGVRRESPLLAQRGDVVWVQGVRTKLCGIVTSDGVAVLSAKGLITLPISSIEIAWTIEGAAE